MYFSPTLFLIIIIICKRKHGKDQERNDKHDKGPKETLRGEKYDTYTHKNRLNEINIRSDTAEGEISEQ